MTKLVNATKRFLDELCNPQALRDGQFNENARYAIANKQVIKHQGITALYSSAVRI